MNCQIAVPVTMQRALCDALFHTYPVWSVALALLSMPYVWWHQFQDHRHRCQPRAAPYHRALGGHS